jgi:IS5 family transposase
MPQYEYYTNSQYVGMGDGMQQRSLSMTGYFDKGKRTRREQFLYDMDRVLPWTRLVATIEPYYPKGEGGRPPLPLARMLRIYFLQQWYNLSDPAAEEALYDSAAMRRFAGVTSDADVIPDETTILNFRRLLEKHELTATLFAQTNAHLAEAGLIVGRGTIVDATIVHAPSSTKNATGKRDPEMHQTQKGKQWYFGMKVHTGTDADSAVVHTLTATPANVHDSQVLGELLHGVEEQLIADAGYASKEAQALAEQAGLTWSVCERAGGGRALSERQKQRNRRISKIRAFVEHPFYVVKVLWGHAKVRYKGIAKNLAQMYALFALANVFRLRHRLLVLQG